MQSRAKTISGHITFSVCLFVCLSVCLSVSLSLSLSLSLFLYLFLSVCLLLSLHISIDNVYILSSAPSSLSAISPRSSPPLLFHPPSLSLFSIYLPHSLLKISPYPSLALISVNGPFADKRSRGL